MPLGKPPKFTSPESMANAAEEYFAKCEEIGRPPLISGLCLHLGIHTETLRDYGTKPEYSAIVKELKLRIQMELEYMAFDGAAKTGAIFNLKCNHHFRDSDPTITIQGNPDAPIRIEQVAVSPIKPILINSDQPGDD